jgi:hypothetical protein
VRGKQFPLSNHKIGKPDLLRGERFCAIESSFLLLDLHLNSRGALRNFDTDHNFAQRKAEIIPDERNGLTTNFFHAPDPDNAGGGIGYSFKILYSIRFC